MRNVKQMKKKVGRPPRGAVVNPALMKAIKIVGSNHNLTLATGICHNQISLWLYDKNRKIPSHQVPKIVKATKGKVRPEELRPDVYPEM